jgi:hypothetical protein
MQAKTDSHLGIRLLLSVMVLVLFVPRCGLAAVAGARSGATPPNMIQQSSLTANASATEPPAALSYVSYLLSSADRVNAAAPGIDGTLYVAGVTLSGAGAIDPTQRSAGEGKAFVARFSSDGSKLLYFTYVDSSGLAEAKAIAVDASGNAYVTGETHAETFPVRNALQAECGQGVSGKCSGDAFVVKLDGRGAAIFSTYFGGSGEDSGNAIALDVQGNIYLTGSTESTDLPVFKAVQSAAGGNKDAFVAEIAADGSRVLFASYLGGASADEARGLAIDREGNIYVTGQTTSVDFPISNAIQAQCVVNSKGVCAGEAFVTKFSPSGSAFVYSTYLGGSGGDAGNAIATDEDGGAYIAGVTGSHDFPLTQPLQGTFAGKTDAFVTKIAGDGSKLVFSTYVGGSGQDEARAIAVDQSGDVFLAGWTRSSNFPTQRPLQASCRKASQGACSVDAFLTALDPTGSQLRFSTYLGGSGVDVSRALAVDAHGTAYSGGWTSSTDFPAAHAPQFTVRGSQLGGEGTAGGSFVAKIDGIAPRPTTVTCSSGTNNNNWVGTAGDGQWATAANWSAGAVPVSTSNACIASSFSTSTINVGTLAAVNQAISSLASGAPISFTTGPLTVSGTATFSADLNISGGTLTLNGASSMTTLEMSAGTLTGSGALSVSGMLTWSGGTESGAGSTTANGGMTITGEPFLDTRTMTNTGTATWSGADFLMLNGSTFNNPKGAIWNDQADAPIQFEGGTSPTFNNAGTFEKTGGTNTTGGGVSAGIVFNNTGVVEANSGVLSFGNVGVCSATCAGSWSVLTGDTLLLGSGTTPGALSGPITGAGTVNFNTGTVNYTGTYNVTGSTTATGGTANFTMPATSFGAITITSGTLNLSTGKAVTTTTLTQSAGTLTGSDALTVTGLVTWSGGTESGTGSTTAKGGMTITGEPFLDTRTVTNTGTATWSGADFLMLNGSTFNNPKGAIWNHQVDTPIQFEGGTNPTFNNAGTFEKTGGTNTTGGGVSASIVFNNTGVVEANSGVLSFGDVGVCSATCAGSWSVLTGDTLQLGSGTAAGALSGPITGAGTVNFNTGTVNYTGTYNVTGGTTVSGGTANFTAAATSVGVLTITGGTLNLSTGKAVTTKTLTQSAGTLTGTDTLTVSGLVTWSGGTESGTGTTTANGGMAISGEPFQDTRTINNSKTAAWSGADFLMLNGSTFNNLKGAIWNDQVDAPIQFEGGTAPTFNNAGTFEKTGGTNSTGGGVSAGIVFNNTGVVEANSGVLSFGDVGVCSTTCAGSWSVLTGDTLLLGSGTTPGALSGPITGAGTVNFNTGTVNYTGTYDVTGGTTVSGGTANFTTPATSVGALTITGGTLNLSTGKAVTTKTLTQSAGTLTGTDALTVTGLVTWSGGTESGTGSTAAKGGMTISGEPFLDTRTMSNSKTATWSGTAFLMLDGSTFNNLKGAIWNHQGDTLIEFEGGTTPTFSNAGTFEKTEGTSTAGGGVSNSITFQNTGTVISESGTLFAGGDYTQASTGTLLIKVSGTGAGQVDVVNVGSVAALSGTLDICPTTGFKPVIGTTFTIMTYPSHTGTFSKVQNGWSVAYNTASIVATYNGAPSDMFSPASLSFPSQLLGSTSAALAVKLTNSGAGVLAISNITLTGADAGDFFIAANKCGATLAVGASCTVSVTFTPSVLGKRTASLSVVDDSCGSPHEVPISGKGTEITLSPSPVAFGSVAVGVTSSPIPVVLTNSGTAAVTVSAVAITGADKGDFAIQSNGCTTIAGAGGTCTITLTFTPAATGARSASLSVTDTDPGSPQTDSLTGTGTT